MLTYYSTHFLTLIMSSDQSLRDALQQFSTLKKELQLENVPHHQFFRLGNMQYFMSGFLTSNRVLDSTVPN